MVENTESTQRQYALRERAVALGWPIERIHVIDSDLGRSGAQALDRDGFQRLVSEVAMGHVYGRMRSARTAELRPTTLKVAREDWQVLIPHAHAGYLSWEEFERNQIRLRDNAAGFSAESRGSVPREGPALLQGRLLCGRCGARMRVRYDWCQSSARTLLCVLRLRGSSRR